VVYVCVFNLKMNFYAVDTMNFTIFDIHLRWTFAQNQNFTYSSVLHSHTVLEMPLCKI